MKVVKQNRKRCKICKKQFQPLRPLQSVCDYKCAIELVKVTEKKAWNKRRKTLREKTKKLSEYKEELQREINKIVRLIDKGHECISSGTQRYMVNAGHLYSVGSFPALRYHLLNIFAQSVHDNKFRGGNEMAYKDRVVQVFGLVVFEEIESLKGKYKELQLDILDIKKVLPIARKIVRELKKQTEDLEKPFSIEERIIIRKEINKKLNIYK